MPLYRIFHKPQICFYYILGLMVFVAALSYFFMLPQSLRLDESQSIWQANRPFRELLEVCARDVHLPLYNILLHFWIQAFGNNIFTNRILSLLFLLISIPMAFVLGRQTTKKPEVGIYLATIFGISPFMIWFGSELRMYSMFVFFSLCAHYFFVKIYESYRPSNLTWILYFLVLMLGVYTHYFFILFIFSQFVFFILNLRSFPKSSIARIGFIIVLLGSSIAPWIWYVRYINSAGSQTPLLTKPSTVDLFNVYSNQFFGFQVDSINSLILGMWPLVGVLCLYFLQKKIVHNVELLHHEERVSGRLGEDYSKSSIHEFEGSNYIVGSRVINRIFPKKYLYYGIMTFLPTLILYSVSLFYRPIFLSRYLIMCLFPVYFLLTSLIFSYRSFVSTLIKITLVLTIGLGLFSQINNPSIITKENYRETINYIISQSDESDIVAISAPFTIYPFKYYYNGRSKLETIPKWDLTTGIPAFDQPTLEAQLTDYESKYKRIYVVLSYDQGYEKKIKETLDAKFTLTSQKMFSTRLNLYVYEPRK
jgi:Dolichyl-phosphate-mannose-protein mannosyltransferase